MAAFDGETFLFGENEESSCSMSEKRQETHLRGSFEACFATGLDLSEFGANNTKSSVASCAETSASFQLLQVKEKEVLRKEIEQTEEIRMLEVVQHRKEFLKRSFQKNSVPMSKAMQGGPNRSAGLVGNDKDFFSALIGNIHSGNSETLNQSRASRQMEVKARRVDKRQTSKGQRPQPAASSSKEKVAVGRQKRLIKH